MRLSWSVQAGIAALLLGSCGAQEPDGRDICTLKAIGEDTGALSIDAELSIPKAFISGAEISNGGVTVMHPGCDFPLNAFLAQETVEAIIAEAATFPEERPFISTATAELFVWRFRDGSQEPRLFVMSYHDLAPINKANAPAPSAPRPPRRVTP